MARHTGLLFLICSSLALSAGPAAAHQDARPGASVVGQGGPFASSRVQAAIPAREEPAQTAT
ncbi:MAG: hypothetical protein M3417_08145, partial [Actinomycetota bacterium]|nr:hypothetical protein [Actinomycetota bacterium]